jgi:hypothetical protein
VNIERLKPSSFPNLSFIVSFSSYHLSFICLSEYSLDDRCGAKQSGSLSSNSDEALDGIIGFGQANSSVLSQLAASGKVKRIFSHCLDSHHGGGIFSIGQVMEPKFNTNPLVPRMYVQNLSFLVPCHVICSQGIQSVPLFDDSNLFHFQGTLQCGFEGHGG